jgi:hypothetical protein
MRGNGSGNGQGCNNSVSRDLDGKDAVVNVGIGWLVPLHQAA